jgi:four helix bundle protein
MHTHFDGSLQTLSHLPRSTSTPAPASTPHPALESLPFQRLDVYGHARELARLVHASSIADAELRDQATRAAKSAFLNLCEGLPDDRPAVRRRYFRQADGSVHEVAGALDLAAAIGALDERVAREGIALAARVRALIRGLLR